jgi:ubiquinone/menaquinone biosynthesis C-methylase UbiE
MAVKAYKGRGMEGRTARWYAKITRKNLPDFRVLAAQLAARLPEGAKILEVAPGPGYLSIELAKLRRFDITGLDISKTFVQIAADNAKAEGVSVKFREGNAAAMPFAENTFDQIVCCAAFKNFTEPVRALQEMHRVLRPGGQAFVMDLRKETPPKLIDQYIQRSNPGAVNSFVIKWTFRLMLLKRAYTQEDFLRFISESGFPKHEIIEKDIAYEIFLTK